MTRLELENERLSSNVQQQKQEVDFKVKELDKVGKYKIYYFIWFFINKLQYQNAIDVFAIIKS